MEANIRHEHGMQGARGDNEYGRGHVYEAGRHSMSMNVGNVEQGTRYGMEQRRP